MLGEVTGKRKGFTLVELLVVISIIALLLSILMPALRRVRKQARAVVCQSNLRQWGLVFTMYANDNNGRLFEGRTSSTHTNFWINALRSLYGPPGKIVCCPTATKPASEGWSGFTFTAWGAFPDPPAPNLLWRKPGDYGSYGLNSWMNNPPPGAALLHTAEYHWRGPNVRNASNVPMLLDCVWIGGYPLPTNRPPPRYDWPSIGYDRMRLFCLDRHKGAINGLFGDSSVRKVGLKELWKLKWHRKYDTNGPYTIAGGVQSEDWPEWMRKFKDY